MPDNTQELQSAEQQDSIDTGADNTMSEQDNEALFEAYSKGENPDAVTDNGAGDKNDSGNEGGGDDPQSGDPVAKPEGKKVETNTGDADNDYSFLSGVVKTQTEDEGQSEPAEPSAGQVVQAPEAVTDITIESIMSGLPADVQAHYADYPEDQKAAFALARAVAEAAVKRVHEYGEIKKLYEELKAEKASVQKAKEEAIRLQLQSELDMAIKKNHPDYEQVIRKDKGFAKWLEGRPAGVQQMCVPDNFSSPQEAADNISAVLDMYMSTKTKIAEKQTKKNSVYAGAGVASARDSSVSGDDEEAMFNEIASKLK